MSISIDLKMRMMLDIHLNEIGIELIGGNVNERTIDLSPVGIASFTTSSTQVYGEHWLGETSDRNGEMDWFEGALVKNPQSLITPAEHGLSHKKNMYVVTIKTPKSKGLYYNEAVSAIVEEYFPNNKHLEDGGNLITVLKSYQQPTPYLNTNLGRFQNRVFIECEIYYQNNN